MGSVMRAPLAAKHTCVVLLTVALVAPLVMLVTERPAMAQVKSDQIESKDYGATRVDFPVPGASGFVIKPSHFETTGQSPWLWYAPTFVKATPQMGRYPNQSLAWLFTRLLDKGVWIAGMDVGESWGNSQGRVAYTRFYKYVRKKFALSPKPCLLGQSRGGLMLFNWAPEHPHEVACMAGIYPLTNLASWPDLGGEKIERAYGMTETELRRQLKGNNPIDRLRPLARASIPIFLIHGDADRVVPLDQNTLEFARRYQAMGGNVEVEVVHGKGHEEVPEYFESERLLDFLLRYLR